MNHEQAKEWLDRKSAPMKAVTVFLVIVSIFFLFKTVNEIKQGRVIGRSAQATNLITVNGEGEVFAVPDIATFTFSVIEEGKTVTEAQKKATEKMNKAIAYLKDQKIADKDVKTIAYNITPKYEYTNGVCTQYRCEPGTSKLVGYEVSQSVEIKVRNTEMAGDILTAIGGFEVQNISGLNFTIDKEDDLNREARQLAIAEAKEKAKLLAKDLGVRIVRVVNFSESSYNPPFYRAYDTVAYGKAESTANVAPEIPTGENKITSNVTITYEIE